jgi:hypothetical protein
LTDGNFDRRNFSPTAILTDCTLHILTIQRVFFFISKQQKPLIFHEKHSIWRERINENSSCNIQRVFSFISKQQKSLFFQEKHSSLATLKILAKNVEWRYIESLDVFFF